MTGALQAMDILQQRYRIMRLLGRGGFGAVYEAADLRIRGRRVAIKEMSYSQFDTSSMAQAVQDFEHEATILASLEHSNIPKVSDFFQEDGKAYIVMDFVEGKTLQRVQEEVNGPLDELRVLNWALQLCDVLNYLHMQPEPVIFRDLKPSNIMITKNEQVKLIDFGIARVFKPSAISDTRMVLSRNFAPPEQFGIAGQQTDARSDMYALGATLYLLLTNRLPVDALGRLGNPAALIRPNILNPQISQGTEALLFKALAMDPNQRFQSAYEMTQAIRATMYSIGMPTTESIRPMETRPDGGSGGGSTGSGGSGGSGGGNDGSDPNTRQSRRHVLRWAVAAGAIATIGVSFGAYEMLTHGTRSSSPRPVAQGPITFDFAYSTEKDEWITPLIDKFNKQGRVGNRRITINRVPNGSVAMQDQIASGQEKPVVWSPASSLELNRLSARWKGPEIIATSGNYVPISLVSSPLVFAIWSERASILLKHYQNSINWANIHDALQQKNWANIGGRREWGIVKFGQTNPTLSNSGLLTITLLAYVAAGKQADLIDSDVNSQAFQQYLTSFDSTVFGFGLSSGPYIDTSVVANGPQQADITCIYENLVLSPTLQQKANTRWHQSLQIFYPDLNILSDHPFAILQAPWVSDDQKRAALEFQKFLLEDEQQKQAVELGFRPSPSNTNVQITDSTINNLSFAQLATLSPNHPIDSPIQPVAQPPTGNVINTLLSTWKTLYPGS